MANTIKLKRSGVPGKVPAAGDLAVGEMAVNTADGTLYTKHTDGLVKKITGTQFVVSATPPIGAKLGEFWYSSVFDILYVYVSNGQTAFYLDISSTNTGYTGSQGLIGYTGSQGITGATGATGATGVFGYTGSQGEVGLSGSTYAILDIATGSSTVLVNGARSTPSAKSFSTSDDIPGNAPIVVFDQGTGTRSISTTYRMYLYGIDNAMFYVYQNHIQPPEENLLVQYSKDGTTWITMYTVPYAGVADDTWIKKTFSIPADAKYAGGVYLRVAQNSSDGTGADIWAFTAIQADVTGEVGATGATGPAGATGATGASGFQGGAGYTGSAGTDGLQGDVGATGPQGNTGATGATGPGGSSGINGYTGSQGATGAQGTGLTILGSVADVASLPSTGNTLNAAYIAEADGDLYVWNGSSWTNVGQIVGPTGPQGAQGAMGYTGSHGATGLQGDVGATGVQGNTGATGATGPQGASGTAGASGAVGYTGSQGAAGYTGSAGTFAGSTSSVVLLTNPTSSTSTTSGAVQVTGGLSVQGNVFAGSVYTNGLFYANGVPYIGNIVGSSNILHVAKNGNNSNDGTINAPFLTIKAALLAAVSGQTVNIAPGIYTEDNPLTVPAGVSLKGDDLRSVTVIPQTPALDLFYLKNATYVWGLTIKDYAANGFAYDPATTTQNVFVSPYVQNVTSSTTASTATAVKIDGSLVSAISTKAMILGFFTIINRGGKGVHLINQAYSQAVNIYTIATDIGILAESGSFITLNGSDNSIGNYGLKAVGKGPESLSGTTFGTSVAGVFQIRGLSAQPKVNQAMTIDGDSNYYGIDTVSQIDGLTWQVTVQEVYTDTLAAGATVRFYQRSAIIASAHTFEYVGAGTNPATALPQYGGIPIEANEVTQSDGGRVTFTSTDHKGNFKIGANLVINQATGIINGDSFNRSMFALMTPYILALEG